MIPINYTTFRALFATSATRDIDGYELWPADKVGSVSSISGAVDSFAGLRGVSNFPITIGIDETADPTYGVDRYHWYLSQRTDDASLQYLSYAVRTTALGPTSYSGLIQVRLTSKCVSDLGLSSETDVLTEQQVTQILRHCYVYVQEIATNKIVVIDLLRYSNGEISI